MKIPAIKAGILQIEAKILRIPLGILQFKQIIWQLLKQQSLLSDCCFYLLTYLA